MILAFLNDLAAWIAKSHVPEAMSSNMNESPGALEIKFSAFYANTGQFPKKVLNLINHTCLKYYQTFE